MKKEKLFEKYQDLPWGKVVQVVPFHDVDSMEVAWHGHYIKYFELARCDLLTNINYDYPQMREEGYAWPVVDISARYVKPARYGEKLEVYAVLLEWEVRLVIHYFLFSAQSGDLLTKGRSVQVPLLVRTGELEFGCPDHLLERVEKWRVENVF